MASLESIRKQIESELQKFNTVFEDCLKHKDPMLQQVLNVVSARRGKMMRPLITLLSAKLLGEVNDRTYYTAASFEFFHTASLVHDDVVDESDRRRGQHSINYIFDNKVAVLVGDYLLAKALYNASKAQSTRLVQIISESSSELAAGELLQLDNVANAEFSEDVYFDIIKGKTAALFKGCAEAGAISVTDNQHDIDALKSFGEMIGMCFQIRDDIFDYNSDDVGKPTGNDMKEGKLTLPVLHVLLDTNDNQMINIAERVKQGEATEEEIASLVRFTKENGGIEYAQKVMFDLADKSKEFLLEFPDSSVRQALIDYVDFVVDRKI